jgi:glutamine synthetase
LFVTDLDGNWRQLTVPVSRLHEESFEDGFSWAFEVMDGKVGQISDVLLIPQPATAFVMPHSEIPTLGLICNLYCPLTREELPDCSRSLAQRAQKFALESGISDELVFSLTTEFFLLKASSDLRPIERHTAASLEANSVFDSAGAASGHWVSAQSSNDDFLNAVMLSLIDAGVVIASHHQPQPGRSKSCLELGDGDLVRSADRLMLTKHIIKRFARATGRQVAFTPALRSGDGVAGLPMQLSMLKHERSVFSGSGYSGLNDVGLHAIGGILKHAPAILAFSSCATGSFKRLQRMRLELAYSASDSRAIVRVPSQRSGRPACIEFRAPDALCNPYLAMTALMMAALDGIQNKIPPGQPLEPDPYDTLEGGAAAGPDLGAVGSYDKVLAALADDGEFLMRGDVVTAEVLDSWIAQQRYSRVSSRSE